MAHTTPENQVGGKNRGFVHRLTIMRKGNVYVVVTISLCVVRLIPLKDLNTQIAQELLIYVMDGWNWSSH